MIKEVELKLTPDEVLDEALIKKRAIHKSKIPENKVKSVVTKRRSIDARGARPFFRCKIEVSDEVSVDSEPALLEKFQDVSNSKEVIIVGAGPAGYFAALELIEKGIKPIVLDRGKDVRARRRDLRSIQQDGIVHPNSNYCFGEGGAGTYSDGKLYTRSHKRGSIQKTLQLLVEHGAKPDILIDAHPHIGSNKLPNIVANIRATIEHYGGQVFFDQKVIDFLLEENTITGVLTEAGKTYRGKAVILATGHSARDIFQLLHQKNILIEAKPFALGVRIEHPQGLIDEIQYNQREREKNLPASSYRLTCQVKGYGVYSFCMCPGGLVVPAATAPGEIVVNGMSMSRRDSAYANSGTVTSVELENLGSYQRHGVFAGLIFQQEVEQTIFQFGDGSQQAPAQRLTDFVRKKTSKTLPGTSYIPGLYSAPLNELLPPFVYERLAQGVQLFGQKMKGYFTDEANVIATESRTSSPIRIPRNKATFMHDQVKGLFPCGEGAGYAGGILSAAMDGQNVAQAVAIFLEI